MTLLFQLVLESLIGLLICILDNIFTVHVLHSLSMEVAIVE
jgi:hypothetical protein